MGCERGEMNEYEITVRDHGRERTLTVIAETAARARMQAEDEADVVAVRFVRAVSFGCHIRGAAPRR